jgi:hypothetical protein
VALRDGVLFPRWRCAMVPSRGARIPDVERRTFLVLTAAAVAATGCTSEPESTPPPTVAPTTASPADPDQQLRARVAAAELALIAGYQSSLESNPGLAGDLEALMADHRAHLERVQPAATTAIADPGATAAATGGPVDSPATTPPTRSPRKTLTVLAEAESLALAERTAACDSAQSPALARDLCLIAASEAQHAQALSDLRAGLAG